MNRGDYSNCGKCEEPDVGRWVREEAGRDAIGEYPGQQNPEMIARATQYMAVC